MLRSGFTSGFAIYRHHQIQFLICKMTFLQSCNLPLDSGRNYNLSRSLLSVCFSVHHITPTLQFLSSNAVTCIFSFVLVRKIIFFLLWVFNYGLDNVLMVFH